MHWPKKSLKNFVAVEQDNWYPRAIDAGCVFNSFPCVALFRDFLPVLYHLNLSGTIGSYQSSKKTDEHTVHRERESTLMPRSSKLGYNRDLNGWSMEAWQFTAPTNEAAIQVHDQQIKP
jgi:hypothetical protein